MRWGDERYVRLYTRDTPDWIDLPWQGRTVFYELLRKVDRAGLVPLGKSGNKGLSRLLSLPLAVINTGLQALLDDGCVTKSDPYLLLPNFVEAQESRRSDVQRQRASREAARDSARASAIENAKKTNESAASMSQSVTDSHECVTPIRAQPCLLSEGSSADAPTAPTKRSRARKPRVVVEPAVPEAGVAPKPEKPVQVAWRLWRKTYAASRRNYGPYVQSGADGKAMATIAEGAVEDVEANGGSLEGLLSHWFRSYLRDPGARNYLCEQRHPLHCFDRGRPTYGRPATGGARKTLPMFQGLAAEEPDERPSREETIRMAAACRAAIGQPAKPTTLDAEESAAAL